MNRQPRGHRSRTTGLAVLGGLAAVASTFPAAVTEASALPPLGLDFDKTAGAPVAVDGTYSITFTFTVTNTGRETLSEVGVVDPILDSVSCPATTVASEQSIVCTGDPYFATQQELDQGFVSNQALASANGPDGTPLSAQDTTTVNLPPLPGAQPPTTLPPDPLPDTGIGDRAGLTLALAGLVSIAGIAGMVTGRRRTR